jgi:hypothetical protein
MLRSVSPSIAWPLAFRHKSFGNLAQAPTVADRIITVISRLLCPQRPASPSVRRRGMTTSTTATRSSPPSESVQPAAPTAADQARPQASPKQTKKHVAKSSRPAPTHFLALPLVTSSSIPQLARSVAHFQDLTTTSRFQPQALEGRERRVPSRT